MLNNKYNLPIPTAIEILDFEKILQDNVTYAKELLPNWQPVESDDYMILLESQSYKELHFRAYINELVKKMLPHYSSGTDLDNFIFGFFAGTTRLIDEDDEKFLDRAMLSINQSVAGPAAAYKYYTYTSDVRVDDVKVIRAVKPMSEYANLFINKSENEIIDILTQVEQEMVTINVYIASSQMIDSSLIQKVQIALDEEEVRPLSDIVVVKAATIIEISLDATLEVYDLTTSTDIQTQIHTNFDRFFKIGEDLVYSEIISSLHINGVYKVTININDDVVINDTEIAKLTLNLNFIQGEVR